MRKFTLILFLTLAIKVSYATHIVGGGFDVQWVGGNNFQISLRVLRDCRNSTTDFNKPNIRIGLYNKNNDVLKQYYILNFISKKSLAFVKPECGGATIECTEEGLYTATVTMNPSEFNNEAGYYLSWERCCRNHIISNINAPGDASTTFYAEIPKAGIHNSTPKYTNNPVTLLCTSYPFSYNFNFTDADSDSLIYTLVDPLNGNLTPANPNSDQNAPFNSAGPYSTIDWLPGFSANAAISGAPALSINRKTGEISVTPNQVGTFVAAIKVEEYRNGVKIGEVRLELQFNVILCAPNPAPLVIATDTIDTVTSKTIFDVEVPNNICFDIKSNDDDSLYMTVASPYFSSGFISQPTVKKSVNGYKNITNRFCWQTSCELNNTKSVSFFVEVKDNGCPIPQTVKKEIVVRIKPMRVVPPPDFTCLGLLNNVTQLNWTDTNTKTYDLLKSYKIYRGVNDTGYQLIGEVGKIATQYIDNNTPNNRSIDYTYKIKSVNLCDSEGVATPVVSTLNSIPKVVPNDSLKAGAVSDTIEFDVYKSKCISLKAKDVGDSIVMRINSPLYARKDVGAYPTVDTVVYGFDSIDNKFCYTPTCEAGKLGYIPFDISVTNLSCPIGNVGTKTIWIKLIGMPPVVAPTLLCMTLSKNNETTVYYGDTSPAENFSYFLVYRGIDFANYAVIDTIPKQGVRYFVDRNSPNNKTVNYCYFMVGVNKCGLTGPTSDTMSTFSEIEYIPQQQRLFTVTVDTTENIKIIWRPSKERDFAKYFLYKSTDNAKSFVAIDTLENVTDTFYVDQDVDVNKQSYCYHLVMYDTCDNIGPKGRVSCSILLQGKSTYLKHNLDWNEYTGWVGGVENYQVNRQFLSSTFESLVKINPHTFTDKEFNYDEGAYNYYVVAKESAADGSNEMLAQSRSNEIFLFQQPNVYAPNAFTLNGDGLNDAFGVAYSFVKAYNLKIYNRWGQLVFESDNKKQSWDGTLDGLPAQADVYFYTIDYTSYDDISYSKKGNVSLLR